MPGDRGLGAEDGGGPQGPVPNGQGWLSPLQPLDPDVGS